MEKIRQALDRARLERAALQHHAVADGDTARRAPRDGSRTPEAIAPQIGPVGPPSAMASEAQAMAVREFRPDRAVLERNRLVAANGSDLAAQPFRMLRTQVLQRMREHRWQTLGVVSARSRDGKTTLASNLSIAIAADPRHSALLVDLDLRRPGIAPAFGLSPEVGIEDVLLGDARVDSGLIGLSGFPGLRILPAKSAVVGSSSLVAGPACQSLIAELKSGDANRIVVVDMPPLLEADEALSLARVLDCLLFVVAEGRTPREDVARGLGLVRQTPVVGTVLNRSVEAVRTEAYG